MKLSEEMKIAKQAARKAGKILMDMYGSVDVSYKPDGTIVTEADRRSERTIKELIEREFPDYSILGEEFGFDRKDSEYMWVIDPLDGTTNYMIKNPFFNVSIGLFRGEDVILGVVYYPFQDEMFYAKKGKGAYLNGKRIKVSDEKDIKKAVLTFCHKSDPESVEMMARIFREFKMINPKVRQIGAAALEMSYVACGRIESFLMINLNLWDIAAGSVIVRESGGRVTDFNNREFNANSRNVLASNGYLHREILEIINQ